MNQANNQAIEGSCLCGQVHFQLNGPFEAFHLCHCSQCQKSTGSAHAANIFCQPDQIKWLAGESLIKRYTPYKAGVISKCFCTHCGSLVPYTSLKSGKLVIPAGSLNQSPDIEPNDNIFWRDRADWYDAGLKAERKQQVP